MCLKTKSRSIDEVISLVSQRVAKKKNNLTVECHYKSNGDPQVSVLDYSSLPLGKVEFSRKELGNSILVTINLKLLALF